MKLVVVSDIHGRYERLIELMELHADADALIFLGDGLRDLYRAGAYYTSVTTFAVKGNCDISSIIPLAGSLDAPTELSFTLDGFKFFAMHGHTHSVKSGLESAVAAAAKKNADVLLFGHTHEPLEKYIPAGEALGGKILERPMYVFNPGSLGEARDGRAHFGLIEIKNGSILFSHGMLP